MLESLSISTLSPLIQIPNSDLILRSFEDLNAYLNYHFSDAALLVMTSELMRLLARLNLLRRSTITRKDSSEERVLNTIEFMKKHLGTQLKLEDFAAHARQSIPYYSKLFQEQTNQSPINYFIQMKMDKACEFLDNTDLSIRDIAERLGYDDPYYFSRLFKKVQGDSPSAYRKTAKG